MELDPTKRNQYSIIPNKQASIAGVDPNGNKIIISTIRRTIDQQYCDLCEEELSHNDKLRLTTFYDNPNSSERLKTDHQIIDNQCLIKIITWLNDLFIIYKKEVLIYEQEKTPKYNF